MVSKFNPEEWLEAKSKPPTPTNKRQSTDVYRNPNSIVDRVVRAVERHQIDITSDYHTWFKIGCSIANTIGEFGRDYFHRISRFYPDYNFKVCDQQYDKCLKGSGGVGVGSLLMVLKDHGIILKRERNG
ncbi:PriCT-2 domain-containing protein [Marinifilum caeruleilacunae]|uniref:Primase C-terminal 2 domain-containing protein n=1 Tax=Marinifilum caeruleilacunae TaxID=2499076 RepID=A0ABX1X1Q2_9BACT|nr:PriCT-2 domain-containing protein [Marinifilum caeruleilacunae]NOU62287.1 hypothetical protein [Marinifilum caeruleilacunae]